MGLCLSLSSWMAPQALAFDPQSGVSKESGPFDLFKFGFFSYKEGRKSDAVEAYRYAAEKGHTGSRWALANMYADGDGVPENDLEAFKIYSEIAQAGVEPDSEDTGYFANALIAVSYTHLDVYKRQLLLLLQQPLRQNFLRRNVLLPFR